MKRIAVVAMLVFMLTGCGVPPQLTTSGVPVMSPSPLSIVDTSEQALLDSAATRNSAQAAIDNSVYATSEHVRMTAEVVEANRVAVENTRVWGTAVAQSTSDYATSISVDLAANQTRVYIVIEQEEAALELELTKASATAQYVAESTDTALKYTTLASIADAESARLANERKREELRMESSHNWLMIAPWVLMVVVIVCGCLMGAFMWMQYQRMKPQQVGNNFIVMDTHGHWQQMNAPQISPPRTRLLADGIEDGHYEDAKPEPILDALKSEQAILVYGAKGTGKTTLLKHLMASRKNPAILDPHGAPKKWPNCWTVGAGRKFDEIMGVLFRSESLMTHRYDEIGAGIVRENGHEVVTIFIDEFLSIRQNLPDAPTIIMTLLTEARKANIDIVMVSHSKNVKALGFEGVGDLREGFAFVHMRKVRSRISATVTYGGDSEEVPYEVILPGPFNEEVHVNEFEVNRAEAILMKIDVPDVVEEDVDGLYAPIGENGADFLIKFAEIDKMVDRRHLSRRVVNTQLYGSPGGESYKKTKWVFDNVIAAIERGEGHEYGYDTVEEEEVDPIDEIFTGSHHQTASASVGDADFVHYSEY